MIPGPWMDIMPLTLIFRPILELLTPIVMPNIEFMDLPTYKKGLRITQQLSGIVNSKDVLSSVIPGIASCSFQLTP